MAMTKITLPGTKKNNRVWQGKCSISRNNFSTYLEFFGSI